MPNVTVINPEDVAAPAPKNEFAESVIQAVLDNEGKVISVAPDADQTCRSIQTQLSRAKNRMKANVKVWPHPQKECVYAQAMTDEEINKPKVKRARKTKDESVPA